MKSLGRLAEASILISADSSPARRELKATEKFTKGWAMETMPTQAAGQVSKAVEAVGEKIKDVRAQFKAIFDEEKKFWGDRKEVDSGVVKSVVQNFQAAVRAGGEMIIDKLKDTALMATVGTVNTMISVMNGIESTIRGVFRGVGKVIMGAFSVVTSAVKATLNTLVSAVKISANVVVSVFKGIGSAIKSLAKGFAVGVVALLGALSFATYLKAQSEESDNIFNALFAGLSKRAERFTNEFADKTGRSVSRIEDELQSMFEIIKTAQDSIVAPFDENAAVDAAERLTERASDLAATLGITTKHALDAFGQAMNGNLGPMRALNVLINEQDIILKASNLGFTTSVQRMTEYQRAMVFSQLILDKTSKAQGGLTKHGKSFAQVLADMKDKTMQAWKAVGSLFAPAVKFLAAELDKINLVNEDVRRSFAATGEKIKGVVKSFVDSIKSDLKDGTTFLGGVAEASQNLWERINNFDFKAFGQRLVEMKVFAMDTFMVIKDTAIKLWQGLVPNGQVDWETFASFAKAAFQSVKGYAAEFAADFLDNMRSVTGTIVKTIVDSFNFALLTVRAKIDELLFTGPLSHVTKDIVTTGQRARDAAREKDLRQQTRAFGGQIESGNVKLTREDAQVFANLENNMVNATKILSEAEFSSDAIREHAERRVELARLEKQTIQDYRDQIDADVRRRAGLLESFKKGGDNPFFKTQGEKMSESVMASMGSLAEDLRSTATEAFNVSSKLSEEGKRKMAMNRQDVVDEVVAGKIDEMKLGVIQALTQINLGAL